MYDLGELYKVSSTDKVKEAERHLKKELEELKNELEENHMAFQLPTRSIRYLIFYCTNECNEKINSNMYMNSI